MLYQFHELHYAAIAPMRMFAEAMQSVYSHPMLPVAYTGFGRTVAAGAELMERTTRRYVKPTFGINSVVVDGQSVGITEVATMKKPFCTLLHFKREGIEDGAHPKVLMIAPMSGHWATLLRGTVETLLADLHSHSHLLEFMRS